LGDTPTPPPGERPWTPGADGTRGPSPGEHPWTPGAAGSSTQHAALLSLRDVRVRRGGQAILDVPAVEVWPGEVLAVVGPNGAGKSTLLQVMALLVAPDAGEVRFRGTVAQARRNPVPVRRRMAVVFQEPLLFDTSVFENVASGLRLRGVERAAVRARVGVWLERLGIAPLAGRAARTLSVGEARRTSLARALVLEPELLLLDEPFGALDYPTRQALLAELPTLLVAARTTTVLVTHDPTEAQALATRAIALQGGRIVAEGAVADVLAAAGLAPPIPHGARGGVEAAEPEA
jgi:tungstate transport system ATP-binding protein